VYPVPNTTDPAKGQKNGEITVEEKDLPKEPTTSLTVGIAKLRGSGTNIVGISEIEIDGVRAQTTMVMPKTLSNLAKDLTPEQRDKLAKAPLDVVMRRQASTPGDLLKDEERAIHRAFTTPSARDFGTYAELSKEPLSDAVKLALKKADVASAAEGTPTGEQDPCIEVASLDGKPLRMKLRPLADGGSGLTNAVDGKGGTFESCDPVRLEAGEHSFDTIAGWPLDAVRLFAPAAPGAVSSKAQPAPAQVDVQVDTDTELQVHTTSSDQPYLFMTGRGFDRRWVGTIDGQPLGEPALVDGYAVGWRIDQPGEHDIQVRFFPQRPTSLGLWFGAAALVGCVGLAVIPNRLRFSRRRRGQGARS
jgi:hypothetical protein